MTRPRITKGDYVLVDFNVREEMLGTVIDTDSRYSTVSLIGFGTTLLTRTENLQRIGFLRAIWFNLIRYPSF